MLLVGAWLRNSVSVVSLIVRGRLYSCVRISMLPVRKENEVALQTAEMRMVRWVCGVKLQDRVLSKELRERLGLDDTISVVKVKFCYTDAQ